MAKQFAQAAGLPGFQQNKTYAAHRVWKGSARGQIKTPPLSRKEASRLYHDARRFERQTRGHVESQYRPGKISHREGRLGQAGLAVFHALLFDFLNTKSGVCCPMYETIAKAACISRASVGRALARLKAAGVLNWIPRCREEIEAMEHGGFLMRQLSNLYGFPAASTWRGYRKAPDPPPPDPATWGATPNLPQLGLEPGQGAHMQTILDGAPPGTLGAQLASLGRRRKP